MSKPAHQLRYEFQLLNPNQPDAKHYIRPDLDDVRLYLRETARALNVLKDGK